MKQQSLLYIKLLGKSYWRLFRELPLLLQILFLFIACGVLFLLKKTEFTGSLTNHIVVFLLFVLIGKWICREASSEKVLLSLLRIPVILIRALKCALLSVPVFLLDIVAGFLSLTLGTLTVLFFPKKRTQNKVLPGFYVPTSYQWLGMYRISGVWVLSIGFLLHLIALWHQNVNMSAFLLGWLIILPAFFAYYATDPLEFLVIYKNKHFLIRKKLKELIVNTAIPTIVSLTLVLSVDYSNSGLYMKLTLLYIYIALLLFYSRYVCYPHSITSFALTCLLTFASLSVFVLYPLAGIITGLLLLSLLHLLAVNNLKNIFTK